MAPRRFRSYRRWKSRRRGGRPTVPPEIRKLIREMSIANPLWGAPRIHGELLKLGIDIGQTSVAKFMAKRRDPPSQGWRTFLRNHADGIAAMDLFFVPTISFHLLYGLLIVGHGSTADFMGFGVTAHPTAEWIANQITEACGWEQAPRYLIRDRDGAYGEVIIRRLRSMGIRDRPTSPRSPWQNGYAESLIGSIRRECLDHVVVLSERHLRHLLLCYMKYYNGARTHLSLEKDAPVSRAVDRAGHILCRPILGGTASPIWPNLIYDGHSQWHLCIGPSSCRRAVAYVFVCLRRSRPTGRARSSQTPGTRNGRSRSVTDNRHPGINPARQNVSLASSTVIFDRGLYCLK